MKKAIRIFVSLAWKLQVTYKLAFWNNLREMIKKPCMKAAQRNLLVGHIVYPDIFVETNTKLRYLYRSMVQMLLD